MTQNSPKFTKIDQIFQYCENAVSQKFPNNVKKFPEVVRKFPKVVKRFPKVVKRFPKDLRKFPKDFKKFHKFVKEFSKVVKKFHPKSCSRVNLSKMKQSDPKFDEVDQDSKNLVEEIVQNEL